MEENEPKRKRRSCVLRKFKRTLLVGLAAAILLPVAGYLYERSELKRIAEEVKPPGELVNIGGRSLHLHVQGEGSPTVILEAGLAGGHLDWTLVAPEVAKVTRVVTSDRAGLWWSDVATTSQTARRVVEDLCTALDKKHIEGPFVLVGHSLGGLHARMFYYMHPDDVAGLVLVDSSDESDMATLPKECRDKAAEAEQVLGLASKLSTFGVTRLMAKMLPKGEFGPDITAFPESVQSAWVDLGNRRSQLETIVHELYVLGETCTQINEAAIPLGDLPLTVLTAGKAPFDFGQDYLDAWMDVQTGLVKLSSSSSHRVVEDSAHYIHIEKPDVVIEEIRRIVERLRASGPESP